MRHRFLIPIIFAVAMAVGCSKSDAPDPSMPDGYVPTTKPIDFQPQDRWETKGTVKNDFAQGDKIGVFAYYLTSGKWDSATPSPNFMYNQEVTKQPNNTWSYTPRKYWPHSGAISFFAYYPYDRAIVVSANNDGIKMKYEIDSDVANHQDFMTSQPAPLSLGDEARLPFVHQMTQVNFYAKLDAVSDINSDVSISSVTLGNLESYDSGQFSSGGFEWVDKSDDNVEFQISNELLSQAVLNNATYTKVNNDNGVMMFYPQSTGLVMDCEVVFAVNVDGRQITNKITKTIAVSDKNFKVNQVTNIQIAINVMADDYEDIVQVSTVTFNRVWNDEVLGGSDSIGGGKPQN